MSIIVKQAVLHQVVMQISNNEESSPIILEANLRKAPLNITSEIEQMVLTLHQVYQSRSIGYGIFREVSSFANLLNKWLSDEENFLTFSNESTHLFTKTLAKYSFAQEGTLFMCHYNYLATDYLFIGMLSNQASMLVDNDLNIQLTQYLDIKQLNMACRVNLTDLQNHAHSKRYLTFIKGRLGHKVGDFFMDYLGAEPGLNPKAQNQVLVQAIDDYCHSADLALDETLDAKNKAFDYCKIQIKNGEDIQLNELSEQLPTLNECTFSHFTQEKDYALEDTIPPVRNSLKSLTKYSGSGKGVTISFDAKLLNDRIEWDEENDRLTINGLPPNLRDQLKRAK